MTVLLVNGTVGVGVGEDRSWGSSFSLSAHPEGQVKWAWCWLTPVCLHGDQTSLKPWVSISSEQ